MLAIKNLNNVNVALYATLYDYQMNLDRVRFLLKHAIAIPD